LLFAADDIKLCLRCFLHKTGDAVDEDDDVDGESDADNVPVTSAGAKKSKAVTVDYDSYDVLYDVDDSLLDDNLPHPKGMIDIMLPLLTNEFQSVCRVETVRLVTCHTRYCS
jgi:hypothetical protein